MARARPVKVLRIGVIRDGKMVQERLIKASETVTVGDSPKCTFVLANTSLPSSEFTLFKASGDTYALCFTSDMRGKISSGGAVVALNKLQGDPGMKRHGDVYQLALNDQDRGKVVLDKVTVLFQFVAPPPTQALRPMQAMDFRPRLFEEDDPVFLGFLAIWLALAVVLSLWVLNASPRELSLEEIPDRFKRIVMVEETPEVATDLDGDEPAKAKADEPEPEEVKPEPEEVKPEPSDEVAKAKQQEEVKEVVLKKSKLLLKLIGTRGESSGQVVQNLFTDDGELDDLDARIKEVGGVTTDQGEATRAGEGTDLGAENIGELEKGGGGSSDVGEGRAVRIAEVSSGSGTVDEDIGDQGKVKGVIKQKTGQLKYCYDKRLLDNPSLSGRVEIGWTLAGGIVEGLYIVTNSTGDQELAQCVMNKIRRWKFPTDMDGDVSFPFVFTAK